MWSITNHHLMKAADKSQSEIVYTTLMLKTSGCPGLDCLLSKNVSELLGADSKIPPNSVSARPGLVTFFVADPLVN